MSAIVSCLQQHDPSLVVWSVVTYFIAVTAGQSGYIRAAASTGPERTLWLGITAVTFGVGAWAAHFTALLAYRQDIRATFDLGLAGAALAITLAGVAVSVTMAVRLQNIFGRLLIGALCSLTVVAMNFMGVAAMAPPGAIVWDAELTAAAIVIGVLGVSVGFASNGEGPLYRRFLVTAVVAAAIFGLHVLAIAAATVAPGHIAGSVGPGRGELLVIIGMLTTLNLTADIVLLAWDRLGELSVRRQLETLSHAPALAFFDREQRLLQWNDAYADVLRAYGLEPVRRLRFSQLMLAVEATGVPAMELRGAPAETAGETVASDMLFGGPGTVDVQTPDGRWFQSTVRTAGDGGVVVAMTDITERRELTRREAEARAAAEAASRAKSEFLANMSHEIRTPLNGVLGMVQIMARNPLDDEQRQRLEIIRESGDALLHVLNNVLDLSKIEAGRVELEAHPFDIEDVVSAAAAAHAPLATQKNVTFLVDVDPQARGTWLGDSGKLRQVISNLLSNAIKFTAAGSVTLRVGWAADGLSFEISDTGVGIASDKLELIFDKFTQADASTTRRFGGSGLGLAICRQLVELMGGALYVTSQEEEGSTFSFGVPLTRAEVQPERAAKRRAEPQERQGPLRILAAEDNATNQLILSALLEPLDVDLVIVENGRLAVEAHATGGFDLILMDAQMPEMNGVEATQAIRARERATKAARMPIIALTANVMQHQINEYRSAGMDSFVAKPISAAVLFEAIEDVLAGGEAAREERTQPKARPGRRGRTARAA